MVGSTRTACTVRSVRNNDAAEGESEPRGESRAKKNGYVQYSVSLLADTLESQKMMTCKLKNGSISTFSRT